MSIYHRHSEFYNGPVRLTMQQMEDPTEVIHHFTNDIPLSEVRKYLWELVEVAITSESHLFENNFKRNGLMNFYRELETVMEAIYLQHQEKHQYDILQADSFDF